MQWCIPLCTYIFRILSSHRQLIAIAGHDDAAQVRDLAILRHDGLGELMAIGAEGECERNEKTRRCEAIENWMWQMDIQNKRLPVRLGCTCSTY